MFESAWVAGSQAVLDDERNGDNPRSEKGVPHAGPIAV